MDLVQHHEAGWPQKGQAMKREYAVVYAKGPRNYSAYAPDLPGCLITASTWEEVQRVAREAIEFHIEGLLENRDPVPENPMSLREAMVHHTRLLEECGEPSSKSPTTVSMVAVDVKMPRATRAS